MIKQKSHPVTRVRSGANGSFSPFRFAVVSDPHFKEMNGIAKFAQVAEPIRASEDMQFVLLLGDLIWPRPMEELRPCLDQLGKPCHVILGNNDRDKLEAYQQVTGPLYYSFEFNNCLFIGLWNAPQMDPQHDHRGDMDAQQIDWLENKLHVASQQQPSLQHIFMFAHVPPARQWDKPSKYWQQPHLARKWFDWCEQYHVTACFFGHVHRHEQFTSGQTTFITTASTNWNFDVQNTTVNPFWERDRVEQGGYMSVEVTTEGIISQLHKRTASPPITPAPRRVLVSGGEVR